MSTWTTDPRAKALIAECAADLPRTFAQSGFGLGGWEAHTRYSNRDRRIGKLKAIRRRVIGDDIAAHFAQPTVEEAIDAAVADTATVDGEPISVREAVCHRELGIAA
jgi:hypothetical protein